MMPVHQNRAARHVLWKSLSREQAQGPKTLNSLFEALPAAHEWESRSPFPGLQPGFEVSSEPRLNLGFNPPPPADQGGKS